MGNVTAIKQSLVVHGQYKPVLVRQQDRMLLAGHHTVQAARELGWTEIAATFIDVSVEDAQRILLVDNRSSDMARTDSKALAVLLQEIADTPDGLIGTGFGAEDLDVLLKKVAGPVQEIQDVPEQWLVLVECADEVEQVAVLEQLAAQGRRCRALVS